ARASVPLNEVVVRTDVLDERETDRRYLAESAWEFVDRMLSVGHYPRRAIPRDAVLAAVYDFISAFEHDDLATFIDATGWDEALNADIREGLRRLGFDGFSAIFAEPEELMARLDPERLESGDGWNDPVLQALDARFSPFHPIEWYYDRLAAWIAGLPYLRSVPSASTRPPSRRWPSEITSHRLARPAPLPDEEGRTAPGG
ncbi:MAG TPA: hypothetical protein VF705_12615, partial [Longimicrobium sp.]